MSKYTDTKRIRKMLEDGLVSGLGGEVGGDKVVLCLRCDADGNERRSACDESVYYYRNSLCRSCQYYPCQPSDFKSAYLCQHVQWSGWVGAVYLERTLEHFYFMSELLVGQSCSAPGYF